MAKQKTNNGNAANLGFEAELFKAADKLRGNMEPSDNKHVALGLIFIKYISDAFEARHVDLQVTDFKVINQMANYAPLEWPDNINISDDPPTDYVPNIRERFSATDWQRMQALHALPEGWEHMSYPDFLASCQ